jgi:NAD(P)-dependent dehydrogenase (short-subunit alcohol dehydrogenase family)
MEWTNQVVLITGASSGIGRAVALRMARLGASLVLASRSEEKLRHLAAEIGEIGAQAEVVPTDVTDETQCRHAVHRALERFGRLTILLCSAGVSMRGRFDETSLSAIEQVMRVNFFGTLYLTHFALPHIQATRGSMVAISSLVGKRGTPTYSIYGASKFAVQGLYEALRVELAPQGVHVGIVSPGHVDTPLREQVLGPDGQPWPTPIQAPFRVWPVEMVVDKVIRLIERRWPEALLPAFVRPLLAVDDLVGTWLGDRFIARRVAAAPLPPLQGHSLQPPQL